MSEELKPCPFCGNDAIRIMREGYVDPEFVGCPKCDVFMRPRRWNARHEPDELPEWVKEAIENEVGQNLNKRSQLFYCGFVQALNWVLSLRKPEAHS